MCGRYGTDGVVPVKKLSQLEHTTAVFVIDVS